MPSLVISIMTLVSFVYPNLLQAASLVSENYANDSRIDVLVQNILVFVNNILIPFILAIGFLVFVYGMFQYFIAGGANDEKQEQGKSLAVYAVLGFVLVVIFWGVVNLVVNSIGLGGESEGATFSDSIPSVPGI